MYRRAGVRTHGHRCVRPTLYLLHHSRLASSKRWHKLRCSLPLKTYSLWNKFRLFFAMPKSEIFVLYALSAKLCNANASSIPPCFERPYMKLLQLHFEYDTARHLWKMLQDKSWVIKLYSTKQIDAYEWQQDWWNISGPHSNRFDWIHLEWL